jgi:hypothetical protein
LHNPSWAAVCCDVVAFGEVWAAGSTLAALRQKPGPVPHGSLPASFLKHADEQTVVGLAAVLEAIQAHGLTSVDFVDWAVLAAPRFLGRLAIATALRRFVAEGAWGMSPHLIPHRSLHSLSGTVSQALKIHGPNFGVGGGPGGTREALFAALALLNGDKVPGTWVVLTGWEPEPVPDSNGNPPAECRCVGRALALKGTWPDWRGARLRLVPAAVSGNPGENGKKKTSEEPTAEALLTALKTLGMQAGSIIWQLDGWGRLELERHEHGTGERLALPHDPKEMVGLPLAAEGLNRRIRCEP